MKQDTDWVSIISDSFDPHLLFKLIEKFVLKQSDDDGVDSWAAIDP